MAMKNTRKTLDEQANTLKVSIGIPTAPNTDVFKANVENNWRKFNDAVSEHGSDSAEANTAMALVKSALALYHDENRMERIEQLKSMDSAEADKEYLRTQCVPGFAIKKTAGKNGAPDTWTLTDSVSKDGNTVAVTVPISAMDYLAYVHPTDMNGIKNAAVIFADNCVKMALGSDAGISRKGLTAGYVELRKRKGWEFGDKPSNSQMAKQLREIFKFMFRGLDIKPINADVKFITHTILQGADKADSAGGYILRNEETIVNAIFRALYTRVNNLAYSFQDKTNGSQGNPYGMEKEAKVETPVVTEDKVYTEESSDSEDSAQE